MNKLLSIILSLSFIIMPVHAVETPKSVISKQVLGISNGIIGSTILLKCRLGGSQPSLIVFMVGGLTFVASEIIGAKKRAKDSDVMSVELDKLKSEMTQGGDYLRATAGAQLDNEKSNLEFIQKRRNWMLALKVIYSAATALAIVEAIAEAGGKPSAGACSPDKSSEAVVKALSLAYGSLLSTRSVKGMAMGVATSMVTKLIFPKIQATTKIVNQGVKVLNSGVGRSIVFGASGALIFMIDSDLAKEEEAIKKNITDLQKVYNAYQVEESKLAAGESKSAGLKHNENGLDAYALNSLPAGAPLGGKTCLFESEGSSGAACKSPIKIERPKFDAKFNMPELISVANTGVDLAHAINSGDIDRADVLAGTIASMATSVNKTKDDLTKKLNESLKAQGKKPLDINAELERQFSQMRNALEKENLASEEPNGTNTSASSVGVEDTSTAAQPVAPVTNTPELIVDQGGVSSEEIALETPADESPKQEGNFDIYDLDEKDISKEKEASIFKQVSNRYILNYTKIFEKKQIKEPLQSSDK